jgi:hypothetical protein
MRLSSALLAAAIASFGTAALAVPFSSHAQASVVVVGKAQFAKDNCAFRNAGNKLGCKSADNRPGSRNRR